MWFIPKRNYLVIGITLLLFLIPFFWIKPTEMDLGGDENRLFFYDPINYIVNDGVYLYETLNLGNRSYEPHFYNLPFISLLILIKSLINSPYFLISLVNGIKISISFLSIYLIVRTILQYSYKEKKELFLQPPAILAGLLYITVPIVMGNFEKALLAHNQIFLNPLCFYLILLYFLKNQLRYLFAAIGITVIFASNFSWTSAPPFFAFFPLALFFLFVFLFLIKKLHIRFSHLFLAIALFLGFHAFHIIPEAYNLFSPGSYINERVFVKDNVIEYLNYYYGVLSNSKLSFNFLLEAPFKLFSWLSVIPIVIIILGFIFWNKKSKIFPLTATFFLLTLYLVTANITASGVKLYEYFFYIPGFSMFRNFVGQWAFVYSFFYVLLFGQAVYFIFKKFEKLKIVYVLTVIVFISIVANGWKLFSGEMVNTIHYQSDKVKIPVTMDRKYEETMQFIRKLPGNDSFISFPFSDSYVSVIYGENNGAYVGASPINRLIGRTDYNGYTLITPFGEIFFKLVKEKKYQEIKRLLGILNVKYIYYNDDSKIYDKTFPGTPYNSARAFLPKTQKEYQVLIKNIASKEVYHNDSYHIYQTDPVYFNSHIYIPEYVSTYDLPQTDLYMQTEPFFLLDSRSKDVYVDKPSCKKNLPESCLKEKKQFKNRPTIQVEKINPTMYRVHVKNAKEEYLLVLSRSFHKGWDISKAQDNLVKDIFYPMPITERQVLANGYANAWYIIPSDFDNKTDYTFTIQLTDQKVFYFGLFVSLLTMIISILACIFFLFRK